MPPQTPTYLPDRLAQTSFLDPDGKVTREWLRHLRDTAQMTRQVLTLLGEIQPDVPLVGRTEGLGTTVQNLDSAGTVLAPGMDLARAYLNKNQDHIPDGTNFGRVQNAALTANQVDLSKSGVIGPLGSAKVSQNVTSNFTNNATVDSIDNGVNATIQVYGPGGVGTSWHQQQGAIVGAELPAFSGTAAYDTAYSIMYDPIADLYHLYVDGFSTLHDGLVYAGSVHTVKSGGTGGTGGGGGTYGGSGGGGGRYNLP